MIDETQTPSLAQLLVEHVAESLADLHTALPARVETYDASTQMCSAQPLVKRRHVAEDGTVTTESHPVIPMVPVMFMSAGAYSITFPIAKGDTVLLIVASTSLDRWLQSGREVDPADDRHHAITDAVAYPGLRSKRDALSGVPSDAMVLTGPTVRIGSSSASDPAVGQSALDAFKTIAGTVTDTAGAIAALVAALDLAGWPGNVVSSKVRVE